MCRMIYRKAYFLAVMRLLENSGRIDRSTKENLKTAKKGEKKKEVQKKMKRAES